MLCQLKNVERNSEQAQKHYRIFCTCNTNYIYTCNKWQDVKGLLKYFHKILMLKSKHLIKPVTSKRHVSIISHYSIDLSFPTTKFVKLCFVVHEELH